MAIWPYLLPQRPLASDYREAMPSNLIRSDTDTGPSKVRRRGNARPIVVTASYWLTTEQCEMLDEFVFDTLGGGAVCFDWPRPKFHQDAEGKDQYVRARIQPGSDSLYAKSFLSNSIDLWQVQLTLEIFPDVPVSSPGA